MYFFRSRDDVMLAVTGLRNVTTHEPEWEHGPLVVRRILPDHTLGPVYTLRPPLDPAAPGVPPAFSSAPDAELIRACQALLKNKPFLEQSDYGRLLGGAKMKWHDSSTWPADEPSRPHFQNRFGKAMAFYHRKDGALVAVMKWGWVLVSHDEGETWSSPVRPPTLVSGMAKTWGQRTADGRYLLAYNPSLTERFPLVAVTGEDGITFGDMRVVHGELPPKRYPGLHKDIGPQYVRGISEWSSDGSRDDAATWLAYSMNKEDIWVGRLPLPPKDRTVAWNTYSPRWAPAAVTGAADGSTTIVLEDRDPADYARAFRVLEGRRELDVTFSVEAESPGGEALHVQLEGPRGERALSLPLGTKGGNFTVRIAADCNRGEYSQWINGQPVVAASPLPQPVERFDRIVFTTGDRPASISPEDDRPTAPARFRVTEFRIARE